MSEMEPRFRRIDGLSIRYAESNGPHERQALLLSPFPESLYAYHATWSRLAEHTHLVAVDLPGFGHSELREDLLTPRAMGEFIVQIADEFEMAKPHVVGPDIGTGATLFAAARYPDRLRSAVVGSGGASVPLQLGAPLHDWVHAEDLAPIGKLGPKDIVTIAISKIKGYAMPEIVREDYLGSYVGQRMVDQMPFLRAFRQDLPVLRELLPAIQTPVQIIGGSDDHVVPVENAEYLHQHLPHSKLDIVDAGHFVWEEAPDKYARIINDWWRSN